MNLFRFLFPAMAVVAMSWSFGQDGSPPIENAEQAVLNIRANGSRDSDGALPDSLANLGYDEYRDIRFRPEAALWQGEGEQFTAQFFHRGFLFKDKVRLFAVANGTPSEIDFSAADFSYGLLGEKSVLNVTKDIGYAGFRIHFPVNGRPSDECLAFLGASYFRGLSRGQQYGLSARGIAVNTAGTKGLEEFPRFSAFWLHRPTKGSNWVNIEALLQGPSIVGSFGIRLSASPETQLDILAKLSLLKNIDQLGVAPLTSMFWFGEGDAKPSDFRPEVHDSDGLLVAKDGGEYLWRPLRAEREALLTRIEQNNPRGFGLVQRDRTIHSYEDLESRFETRPSAWIEPVGDWGRGSVVLYQFPTDTETVDNVVAFWEPAGPHESGQRLEFRYRLTFLNAPSVPANLATVVATRISQIANGKVRFLVDFKGSCLVDQYLDFTHVTAETSKGTVSAEIVPYVSKDVWRVILTIAPDSAAPIDISCRLHGANVARTPISETWSYTWKP